MGLPLGYNLYELEFGTKKCHKCQALMTGWRNFPKYYHLGVG